MKIKLDTIDAPGLRMLAEREGIEIHRNTPRESILNKLEVAGMSRSDMVDVPDDTGVVAPVVEAETVPPVEPERLGGIGDPNSDLESEERRPAPRRRPPPVAPGGTKEPGRYYNIMIPKQKGELPYVALACNGRNIMIPRGVKARVHEKWIEIMDHATEMHYEEDGEEGLPEPEEVMRVPYQNFGETA